MRRRIFPIAVGIIAALATLVLTAEHARALKRMRTESNSLRLELDAASRQGEVRAADPTPAEGPVPSLLPQERIELMQLRSRVTGLRDRQRQLARVRNENAQLHALLKSLTNGVPH